MGICPSPSRDNFRFIMIYAGDLMAEFGKAGPAHQSNVTRPDDSYFHEVTFASVDITARRHVVNKVSTCCKASSPRRSLPRRVAGPGAAVQK